MQTIREMLLGEKADRRKLDMLVRQGMMSPAALPMLHRGLDKLQQGKTLNPMERDAVAKVVDSLLYIVTGDDTVFQKARQHTQKTKYQTEEAEEVEEKMDMKKADMGDVIKDFQSSDAPQFKGKTKEKKREMAIAAKLSAEETEEIEENRAAFSGAANRNKMLGKLQKAGKTASEIGDPKKRAAAKAALPKIKKRLDYGMKEESPAPDNLDSSYKAKFAAMLKKTGKSLGQMSDEEKKKFFNSVDAAHKAKNEEMKTTGPGVKMGKPIPAVGGKTQKVGGKLSHPPRKPNRLKPDPMFAKNQETVDEDSAADVLKRRYASNHPDDNPQATKRVKDAIPGVATHKMHPNAGLTNRGYSKKGKMAALKKQHARRPEQYGITREETVDEGAMSRIDYQQKSGEKGSGLETFKKKPAVKDTLVASPKTQRVKRTTAKAAERMVKKGAVYAEDAVSDSEEMRAKTQRKLKRMSSMKANQEKKTDPGIKEDARSDARRAMRADSKGMAPLKKPGATKAHTGTKAGDEKHGGHIVVQLRKAVSISKPVKFKDGTTKPISKAHAHKFLSKYNAGKPAEKEAMHGAHDSHDAFMKHINK